MTNGELKVPRLKTAKMLTKQGRRQQEQSFPDNQDWPQIGESDYKTRESLTCIA